LPEKFDVAVVGGGPAGLAAAYVMGQAGLNVIVLERGEYPGAKNVSGAVLYSQATNAVFPKFWQEAPLERPLVEQNLWITTEDAVVKMGYRNRTFNEEPYNNFSVLRAKFDRWMGRKVEEIGVVLVCETTVEDLLMKDNRVIGVKTGRPEGEVLANVVVLAEGCNSILTQEKLGFKKRHAWDQLAVAVKEIIALPKEKIEDRFGLEPGQGATIELVGWNTKNMIGTGFIYTNKESLSVGVGALMSQMIDRKVNPNDLLEHMKSHPAVKPLIEGGELKEYEAKIIPEGGYHAVPRLYGDGVVIVGDAAMLVNGLHREGANLAMTSGKVAAEVIVEAHKTGDYSAGFLKKYHERLNDTFVLKDLHKYRNANQFFDHNPQFFQTYPEMLSRAAKEFLTVDSIPKKEKQRKIYRLVKEMRSPIQIGKDMLGFWRTLG
jgi:electron transfer flavoprotein-quinone oxidoreductase